MSSGNIPSDQDLSINTVIELIKGAGYHLLLDVEEDTVAERSVITIPNTNDNICLSKAIVVAVNHLKYRSNPRNDTFKKNMTQQDVAVANINTMKLQV